MPCVLTIYALDQNENETENVESEIVTHEALAGDEPVTASLTTRCPSCNHMSYDLHCGGSFDNPGVYADDVDCSIQSHSTSSQCVIWDRLQYKTNGSCTHAGCGRYEQDNFEGQHTESCRHTNYDDNNLINTCSY